MIRRIVGILALLACGSANAQFSNGQILTAGQLNSQFALYVPLAGGSMTGPLTATGLTLSALTANSFLYSGTGGALSSTSAPTNGQLLIGSTGAAPVAATLTGVANQISVSNGAGSITLSLPSSLTVPGTITSYNGIPTVSNGIASEVAQGGATNQTANVISATLYAVPASGSGMYRASCYLNETTAATTSSTLPSCVIGWTDSDSGVAVLASSVTPTNPANAAGAYGQGVAIINAKASTNITYSTTGYASSGATSMQYSVRVKLEAL